MNIIEKTYTWNGKLVKRKKTDYIIIHHCAGTGDADYIHNLHIGNGWTGFGYHFYVRTNGEVYRGRPIDCAGAHTVNYNSVSVGICFEGNYETTKTMPAAQLKAGKELVAYLKKMYPNAKVGKHRDYASTACPGKHFPYDEITGVKASTTKPTTTAGKTETKGAEVALTLNTLEKGSNGKQVKTLQRLLIALGHSCGTSGADGDFGGATLAAVEDFQSKNGLSIDGIVGLNTWNALLK